ncbi:MAG: MFS transporter [Armatimonadetes bacterium]|nr:MFS transporter [Armatimonadota bacterium]
MTLTELTEEPARLAESSPRTRLALLSFSHLWIDFYATMYAPLAETFRSLYHVSLSQISWLPVVVSVFGSMSQPLYGLLGDRFNRIGTAAASLTVAAVFMSLIGFAPSLPALGLLLVLGSLGISAFHPNSAAAVTEGQQRASFAMSIFMVGGSAGLAVAPTASSYIAENYGLRWLWVAVAPGLLMALALLPFIRGDKRIKRPQEARPPIRLSSLFERGTSPVWLLLGIATMRSFASVVFQTFISFLGKERGWSVEQTGHALSIFLISGTAGSLTGGYIADRVNPKAQITWSCLLTIPFLLGFVHLDSALALVSFGIAGFLTWVAQPVNISLAQELRPQSAGAVSGLMLGLAWGTAGLFMQPFGSLADRIGVETALSYAPFALLLAAGCAMLLPGGRQR